MSGKLVLLREKCEKMRVGHPCENTDEMENGSESVPTHDTAHTYPTTTTTATATAYRLPLLYWYHDDIIPAADLDEIKPLVSVRYQGDLGGVF